jgi:hypothetical protein
LNWKEILSLIDDYYKVNSFLVESNALFDRNFILPKFVHSCMDRFHGRTSKAREGEKQLDMVLYMKTIDGRPRDEREACAVKGEEDTKPGVMPDSTDRYTGRPDATPGAAGCHVGAHSGTILGPSMPAR